jgi:predicted RNase H-like HicB family nuclease
VSDVAYALVRAASRLVSMLGTLKSVEVRRHHRKRAEQLLGVRPRFARLHLHRNTLAEIEKNIREAIEYHIEGMIEDGDPIPEPSSHAIEVEVSVA